MSLRYELFRLCDPTFDAARKPDLLADLVGVLGNKLGNLPIMEDAEIVEPLLDRSRHAAHVLDAAERAVELVALALPRQTLLLGVALGLARGEHLLELAQALDRFGDGLPVGERAAEPARVHVILRRALGSVGDRILRL